jgi:hypothetical protein
MYFVVAIRRDKHHHWSQMIDEIRKSAITSAIKAELLGHFGGGLSDERVIRDSEANFVASRILERIIKVLEEKSENFESAR